MRKVLIMGGSIFIGKAIAEKFISLGDTVYILNRGNHTCPEGAIQLLADRNDVENLSKLLKDYTFDVVVDCSAYELSQTKLLFDILKDKVNHFIHISSAAVYSDTGIFPFCENSSRGLQNAWGDYSKNKYLCEEFLFEMWEKTKFPVTIIRPFYVYGPSNKLDRESYVFSRILNEKTIIIPSRGKPLVQFGHIDDLCDAIALLCGNEKTFGEAYNISGDEYISFVGWVKLCAHVVNKEAKIELINEESYGYKARDWFPFRAINFIGDCSKIKTDVGFINKYSIFEGLKQTFHQNGAEYYINKYNENEVEGVLNQIINDKL